MAATRARLLRHPSRHRLRRDDDRAHAERRRQRLGLRRRASAFKDVDSGGAARTACDKALRSRGGKPLDPGVYPVVLEPAAVAGLLSMMSLEARNADEGRSAFSKPGGGSRIGEKMFGSLTLQVGSRGRRWCRRRRSTARACRGRR